MADLTHIAKAKLRKARHMSDDFIDDASELIEDASDTLGSLYDDSQNWLQKNYGKTLGGVAVVAAVGLLGFFIGKGMSDKEHGGR